MSTFTITSTEDAIHMAQTTLGGDDLAALVTGARLAMPVSGEVPPDGVLDYHAVLLQALADERDQLVLATRRRTGPPFVTEEELARWRELKARHDDITLDLADWLVFVRDEVVLSLAEIAGPAARWVP